jgi:hypothetical protein
VLGRYGSRPEHKSLQPDDAPAGENSTGQLHRRPIRSGPEITALIGKEGNRLLERATGEITDPDDYRTTYTYGRERWRQLALPVLRDIREKQGTRYIAERVGVSDRQVRNWLAGRDEPHAGASGNRQRAERLAVGWAADQLRSGGKAVPSDPYAVLYAYKISSAQHIVDHP